MDEQLHWLWPTLIQENKIDVEDVKAFNLRLLKTAQQWQNTSEFLALDTPEVKLLKEAFIQCASNYLKHVGMDSIFHPGDIAGWVNIYQPGQYIQPHYHGAVDLTCLYYATDETDEPQRKVTPIDDGVHTMSKKHGYTSFHDPRNAFEMRPNPVVEFKPMMGYILTAPGHVMHWTLPTNKLRVVIAARITMEDH